MDRPMSESERQPLAPYWYSGSESELRRVFSLVVRLYVRRGNRISARQWGWQAINPTMLQTFRFKGGIEPILGDMYFSPVFLPLMRVFLQHFVWVFLFILV